MADIQGALMKMLIRTGVLVFVLFSSLGFAEVKDAGAGGFTVVNTVVIDASGEVVWKAAVDDIGLWWSSDHTISGEASRLSITAVPQGCFCESFGPGAGVVHLSVTMVSPGVLIRLTGGLGPLGLMGVNGNMTWEFEAVDTSTQVTFTYAVGGYRPEGLDTIAAPVDYVIGEALARLKAQVETGDPENADIG
jgi:uncharacterized protein YndB with AHSA1/START domain